MIPATVLAEVGGFDEQMELVEDQDLWFRIARRYAVAALPEPCVIVRIHQEGAPRDPEVVLPARLYATRKAFRLSPDIGFVTRRRLISSIYGDAAYVVLKTRQFHGVGRSARHLLIAWLYDPFTPYLRILVKLMIALAVKKLPKAIYDPLRVFWYRLGGKQPPLNRLEK